jgi:serine/threonine protein kinase
MAPEIQKRQLYSNKSDLWSVGIIMFELLAGLPPFTAKTREELQKKIAKGYYKVPPGVEISDVA